MAVLDFWLVQPLLISMLAVSSMGRVQTSSPESDLVTNLPGQPAVSFRHYAGYIKLRQHDEKALFYWFFEAQDKVAERPLLLWLNGGPGCSSVAYGAAQELGPFLVRHNSSDLVHNKFSWNKAANLLFLESPIGVGYSYTNKSIDLQTLGDNVTADDSHAFLMEWFNKFPKFRSNEFYIAGESYAGHYVPQLSELIHDRNKGASKDTIINFKGFMIGNAVINDATDELGFVDYAWSHAIISDQLRETIIRECNFTSEQPSKLCGLSLRALFKAYSDIDIYSIYAPVCLDSNDNRRSHSKLVTAPKAFTKHDLWHNLPSGFDPCTEEYTVNYFNKQDVQKALHANVTQLYYPYSSCSSVIRKWVDSADSTLHIIQKLLKAGLRIWVYSGDTDGRVPVTSTRYSINEMNSKVKEEWRSWFYGRQVAGWVTTYENGLTLATVRGAGHQVPVFAPAQSLSLVSHFISGTQLPANRSQHHI